jgi:hypothetical protein
MKRKNHSSSHAGAINNLPKPSSMVHRPPWLPSNSQQPIFIKLKKKKKNEKKKERGRN